MNRKKTSSIAILIALSLLADACGGNDNTDVAVIVALTQTAAAQQGQPALPTSTNTAPPAEIIPPTESSVSSGLGIVTGTVSPQSAALASIYALNSATGQWVMIQLAQNGNALSYTLNLAPGNYQIFAFPTGLGYSLDGVTLATVAVAADQTVSNINLVAPNQTSCGPAFGVPASPDGSFAAIAGASADCLAAPKQDYVPMSAADCAALNTAISSTVATVGTVVSPVAFQDYVTNKSGSGCLMNYATTGATGIDLNQSNIAFQSLGWVEDINYGAGGPTGMATAYRKDKTLCLVRTSLKPSDASLCPGNEPFGMCWDRLTPDQRLYGLTITCAQATTP